MDIKSIEGMMRRMAAIETTEQKAELAVELIEGVLSSDHVGLTFMARQNELVVFQTDGPRPIPMVYGGMGEPGRITAIGGDSAGTFAIALLYAAKTTKVPLPEAVKMLMEFVQSAFGCQTKESE